MPFGGKSRSSGCLSYVLLFTSGFIQRTATTQTIQIARYKSSILWAHTKTMEENNGHIAKMTADYETFTSRAQTDEDGYYRNPVKLGGLAATDAKSVGTRLQEIAKNAETGGEYLPIGELYGFPILVKTEKAIREGMEVKQNRFFIDGAYKYTYNNGQLAMADHKAAATNFLNALDRISKLMEQYKTENAKLEKDLPTLREIVGGTWKKEEELKQFKSEVAALERKIQLTLPTSGQPLQDLGEGKTKVAENNDPNITRTDKSPEQFFRDPVIIARPAPVQRRESNGMKL